ncbi:MAG: CBS domain-containing protein, partial [Chloroflexi bacterium]|nr:CBS domain-containing protein [Chloroflexota bacterium]
MSFTRERKLVRDLMQVGVATCPPHASVPEVARLLQERGLEAVVVLDPEDGHALGFTGREELMRAYLRRDARSLSVSEVMREDVPQVPPDIPLETAVQLMLDR